MRIWPFRKKSKYEILKKIIHDLCSEWIEQQTSDLEADDMPPKSEIDSDCLHMANNVFTRITPLINSTNACPNGRPEDDFNLKALEEIIPDINNLEEKVPSFTKLALSKMHLPEYGTEWGLCAIRLIAESSLNQIRAEQSTTKLATGPGGEKEIVQKLLSLLKAEAPLNWHEIQSVCIFENQVMRLKNYYRESEGADWKVFNLNHAMFDAMDCWEEFQKQVHSSSEREITAARAIFGKDNRFHFDKTYDSLDLSDDSNVFKEEILELINKIWGVT